MLETTLETTQTASQESIINTDLLKSCKSNTVTVNRWSVDEIVVFI